MGASFSVVRVQFYGLVVVLYGPLVLAQVTVGNTPVVVGLSVVRVQFYGLVVVFYGPLSEIKCWHALETWLHIWGNPSTTINHRTPIFPLL